MTKKQNTGTLIAIAALVAGGYMWWKEQQAKAATTTPPPGTIPGNTTTATTPPPVTHSAYDYPIINGRLSYEAKLLQKEVGVTQDGIIGPKTIAAVRVYLPDFPDSVMIPDKANLTAIITAIQVARNKLYNEALNN